MAMASAVRALLLLVVGLAVAFALYRHGPIAQDAGYHHFADTRTLSLGGVRIPNALNVLTNLPFALVGMLGLAFLRRGPSRDPDGPYRPGAHTAFESLRERPAYVLFFVGVLLTTFGSGYYHLAPSTMRLFWDRLPMAIGFSAIVAAVMAERVSIYWSRMALLPLVFIGIASVVWWRITELHGHGDLRAYLFVQLFPVLSVPLMLALFPARYSRGIELLFVVLVYVGAKAAEHFDLAVWEITRHVVSGHSVKHVLAALATWLVVDMLKKRGRAIPRIEDMIAAQAEDDAA